MSAAKHNFSKQRLLAHQIKPIKQFDSMACWAACLSWWASARRLALGISSRQLDLLSHYVRLTHRSGGMSFPNMRRILGEPRWKATVQLVSRHAINHRFLRNKLKSGPLFVAFFRPNPSGLHANIIIGPSINFHGKEVGFIVMEPDPGKMTLKTYGAYSSYAQVLMAWPRT